MIGLGSISRKQSEDPGIRRTGNQISDPKAEYSPSRHLAPVTEMDGLSEKRLVELAQNEFHDALYLSGEEILITAYSLPTIIARALFERISRQIERSLKRRGAY